MQQARDRFFLATFPSPSAADACRVQALTLRDREGLTSRAIPTERLHITLVFLGDFAEPPTEFLDKVARSAAQVKRNPFRVTLDRARSLSPSPACVFLPARGASELHALHLALATTLHKAGLNVAVDAAYLPHLSLIYDSKRVVEQPMEPVSWVVNDFALMHSVVGRGSYRTLQTFPLAP